MMNEKKDDSTVVPLFYKNLKYYPTLMAYSQLVTVQERLIWISIYIMFFMFLFVFSYNRSKNISLGLTGGFLSGLLIFVFEYYQKATDQWVIFNELDNNAYKIPVNVKPPVDNNWSIYVDDSILPSSDDMGYLINMKTLNYNVKNNNFVTIPLASIYTGVFKKTVNMGSQSDPIFFSNVNDYIARNSFYLIATVLAWGMFIIKTRWFNFIILFWILLALILSIITGTLIGQSWNIYNSNYIIQTKKILLVFSIAVAITSVLIA